MSGIDADERYMAAAIALARRGLGACAPNPAVGALIVKDGAILARGWTQPGGRPHAEVEALRQAGEKSRGSTLYVTLEPCSHHGKTPPCAEAVAASGVARVVSAIEDPDPRVAGRGHELLRAAGLDVRTGVCAQAALAANLGHVLRVTQNRPLITLKLAMTADGFVAAGREEPRLSITGEAANRAVHVTRAMHDAILIGVGTALADDPLLTVRLPGLEQRRPLRIVLDSSLRISPASRLVATARSHPTLIIAGEAAPAASEARLLAENVAIARAPTDAAGRLDLRGALALLAARGLTRIFCEAGPTLAEALLREDVADDIIVLTSQKPLARPGLCGFTAERINALEDGSRYRLVEQRAIGDDLLTRRERIS
ncbi:bifunctional diaminohydroxyphosphoribosylaminopyrimidine deaminase/5-amino-6-(5-phosphoribosylamino)uracil reductase RibD [Methylocella silvestris]|uniref:Riboflavin biosynthesis protein RibD n=1 Tax=Methylocella silvestris TaxID=199596 RepID=A0A2J7THR1_METSI|nr:bifunctional diaminohydroxyphosphoribosylaminopyrimidine deaminase/5-amino-6-(5-phosphoribosylamino)uracil reductase RibD [Methylocella silvestris]PNG26315.1 riboflavin biosynthesis protein RibD [Methylocella silvestris]